MGAFLYPIYCGENRLTASKDKVKANPLALDKEVAADKQNTKTSKRLALKEEKGLPEDTLSRVVDTGSAIIKREVGKRSADLTVSGYVGPKWRVRLDQDIEVLYARVAVELNDNSQDVVFALEKLRNAQSIIINDTQQYDEALDAVLVVKEMLLKKRSITQRYLPYAVLVYALIWLSICFAGFFINPAQIGVFGIRAWYSALAGGIGGVVVILYNLYWQVSIKQKFESQYLMMYLVQPILGVFLGVVMFFIVSTGFLAINNDFKGTGLLSLQLVLSFVAGFGQQPVYRLIDRIIQGISPKGGEKPKRKHLGHQPSQWVSPGRSRPEHIKAKDSSLSSPD